MEVKGRQEFFVRVPNHTEGRTCPRYRIYIMAIWNEPGFEVPQKSVTIHENASPPDPILLRIRVFNGCARVFRDMHKFQTRTVIFESGKREEDQDDDETHEVKQQQHDLRFFFCFKDAFRSRRRGLFFILRGCRCSAGPKVVNFEVQGCSASGSKPLDHR